MASILSSAEKETLVSSFLEIAVGRSIETAEHFLQAKNWRIEDALESYYVRDIEQSYASSSNFLPAEFTPLQSDPNYSKLGESICSVNAGQSDAPNTCGRLPFNRVGSLVMDSSSIDVCLSASAPNNARQKKRTHTEEQITPQVSIHPPSIDVVEISHRTTSKSTDSPRSRQSKRLRDLQQNSPLQSADLTYSRKSRRLAGIQEGCLLEVTGLSSGKGVPELSEADMMIFLGDFNYRLDGISYDEAKDFISQRCFNWLKDKDQLRPEMEADRVFQGTCEAMIKFPTTYKFERHQPGLSGIG